MIIGYLNGYLTLTRQFNRVKLVRDFIKGNTARSCLRLMIVWCLFLAYLLMLKSSLSCQVVLQVLGLFGYCVGSPLHHTI